MIVGTYFLKYNKSLGGTELYFKAISDRYEVEEESEINIICSNINATIKEFYVEFLNSFRNFTGLIDFAELDLKDDIPVMDVYYYNKEGFVLSINNNYIWGCSNEDLKYMCEPLGSKFHSLVLNESEYLSVEVKAKMFGEYLPVLSLELDNGNISILYDKDLFENINLKNDEEFISILQQILIKMDCKMSANKMNKGYIKFVFSINDDGLYLYSFGIDGECQKESDMILNKIINDYDLETRIFFEYLKNRYEYDDETLRFLKKISYYTEI